MVQISNRVFCLDFLFNLDIKTKLLPNPYKEYPFLIIDDFLSKEEMRLINKQIKKENNFIKAKLKVSENSSINHIDESIRKTKIHKLNRLTTKIYSKNFKKHQVQIESFFNLAMVGSTKVQVLEYLKDSFYSTHSDDSSMLYDDEKLISFIPVAKERKLSTVLFITDHKEEASLENEFSGGELVFNYLFDEDDNQIEFKPKSGQMIIFPSNPFFAHEVKKVKSGRRISLVQWHNAILN